LMVKVHVSALTVVYHDIYNGCSSWG
jgi:hypothetical protein